MSETKINWDYLGIATSVACAIHCALLPLVLTALPIFGINIIHNYFFEWGMIALAFGVGTYSLIHSYIKHHQNKFPLILFFSGFVFLILKQVFHQYEFFFLVPAVILIVYAHVLNFKYCRHTKQCDSDGHVH